MTHPQVIGKHWGAHPWSGIEELSYWPKPPSLPLPDPKHKPVMWIGNVGALFCILYYKQDAVGAFTWASLC